MSRLPWSIALVLTLMVASSGKAAALSCMPPDPWFLERVSLGSANLPAGVTIQAIDLTVGQPSDADVRSPILVRLVNSSATPLYVLVRADTFRHSQGLPADSIPPEQFSVALPSGTMPGYRAANGEAWEWSPVLGSDWNYHGVGWVEPGSLVGQRTTAIAITRDRLASIADGVTNRNVQIGQRPNGAAVPASQSFEMLLVSSPPRSQATTLLHVPVAISYILNPGYDPRRADPGWCSADLAQSLTIGLGVLVLGLAVTILVVSTLAIRLVRKALRARSTDVTSN